jgi:hypothetical protein
VSSSWLHSDLARASEMTTNPSPPPGTSPSVARGTTRVPDHVMRAIYGDDYVPPDAPVAETTTTTTTAGETHPAKGEGKAEAYDASLKTWWKEYADRKNDEDVEHVSDSLLYDYTHLPRSTPAPTMTDDRVKKVG